MQVLFHNIADIVPEGWRSDAESGKQSKPPRRQRLGYGTVKIASTPASSSD